MDIIKTLKYIQDTSEFKNEVYSKISDVIEELEYIDNQDCDNCKYYKISGCDAPCRDCSVRWSNYWEEK